MHHTFLHFQAALLANILDSILLFGGVETMEFSRFKFGVLVRLLRKHPCLQLPFHLTGLTTGLRPRQDVTADSVNLGETRFLFLPRFTELAVTGCLDGMTI